MRIICSKQFCIGAFVYSIHFYLSRFTDWYPHTLLRMYLGDLLALIVLVPLFVFFQTLLGIQRKPYISFKEIVFYFLLISVVFELISPFWIHKGTSDILDIFCYAISGLLLFVSQLKNNCRHS